MRAFNLERSIPTRSNTNTLSNSNSTMNTTTHTYIATIPPIKITHTTPHATHCPLSSTTKNLIDTIALPISSQITKCTTQTSTPHISADVAEVTQSIFEAISFMIAIMALMVGILQLRIEYSKRRQRYTRSSSDRQWELERMNE
jgi:hypothetical protein